MVDKIQGDNTDKGKGNAERPLSADLSIRGSRAAVEYEEAEDEDALVEELTPALHGESEDDISAAMNSISECSLVAVVAFHSAGT